MSQTNWDYKLDQPEEPALTDECGFCGTAILEGDVFCSRNCSRANENDRHEPREEWQE